MNLYEQILALLVAKFQGTRKDGLEVLARALSQTNETIEEAQAVVNKMTPEKVESFIKDWRKSADTEIQKANQTYENGLKEKYEFVEKKPGETKPTPPAGDQPLTAEKITEIVNAAVSKSIAGISAQVEGITGAQLLAQRKAQLEGIFSGQNVPEAFKKAILDGFEGRSFKDDDSFNAYLAQQKESVAAITKEMADAGLGGAGSPLFGKPGTDGVSSAVSGYINDQTAAAKGEGASLGGKSL